MSGDNQRRTDRAEEFVQLFSRGAEFTREMIRENERLRVELAQVRDRQESAAQDPRDWGKLREELLNRIDNLEVECTTVRERLDHVERENSNFARRCVEIEEENNNLANLYVASYQLHSTLDLDEVLKIIMEIVINLVGAEVFAVYLLDDDGEELTAVASEGLGISSFPKVGLGSGVLGKAVASSEATCWNTSGSRDLSQPIVCVPLSMNERPIGAIVVFNLLQQKDGFSPLDHELFNMLGGHAATALFAAKLYSQSERKLNTIQGFIDLLTN
jgi:regulator of replication initiation timing